MSKRQSTKPENAMPLDENALKQRYGKHAVVVRLGQINIVHLDHPSEETIRQRTEEIMREEMTGKGLDDDCPCGLPQGRLAFIQI